MLGVDNEHLQLKSATQNTRSKESYSEVNRTSSTGNLTVDTVDGFQLAKFDSLSTLHCFHCFGIIVACIKGIQPENNLVPSNPRDSLQELLEDHL